MQTFYVIYDSYMTLITLSHGSSSSMAGQWFVGSSLLRVTAVSGATTETTVEASLSHGCMKRAGYNDRGRASFIPTEAAQCHRKPKIEYLAIK